MNLRNLGEDRLLARLLPQLKLSKRVIAGAGDDCAVLKKAGCRDLLLFKTDAVVEGIHFRGQEDPVAVGWKAMMRPLSDFAAMSGVPESALVTLIAPGRTPVKKIDNLYRGLQRAAAKFNVAIVGGETSNTRGPLALSVSVLGHAEKNCWVSRAGGKAGDDLYVTGRLGGSRRRKHLWFVPRIEESRWLTKNFRIHAMMDLSDGLGADLPRLANASRVGFKIDRKSLPRAPGATIDNAISDGEDYELLFAISARNRKRLQKSWRKKFPRLLLTRIGKFVSRFEIRDSKLPHGYVHFQ